MKTRLNLRYVVPLLVAFNSPRAPIFAQGTLFTYQGRLNDASNPADGSYDLLFKLYDSPTGGLQQGFSVTNLNTPVSNGLFTLTLDFGNSFSGAPRWLDIAARTNLLGAFVALTPRQLITPSPYAITASKVAAGGLASGTYGGALILNNPANSFSGDGGGLTNVNAATLGGRPATSFWQVGGNLVLPGEFVGSTNNQALELFVNGARALRLEPGATNAPNVVGGWASNTITPGVVGAVIAGGGGYSVFTGNAFTNRVTDAHGVVSGGVGNLAGNDNADLGDARYATVAGGALNESRSYVASVGGGQQNVIETNTPGGMIGGGELNTIQNGAVVSTIAGGFNNTVETYATECSIAGGIANSIRSNSAYSSIGGGNANTVGTNANSATIAGGNANSVGDTSTSATIGGGSNNTVEINVPSATIGGGQQNKIQTGAGSATISGGILNTIKSYAYQSSIAGGFNNTLNPNAYYSAIGGGANNTVSSAYATVPGGTLNIAGGAYSFAAGDGAYAAYDGSFVWADSQGPTFQSTAPNQFLVRAAGGVGININNPAGAALSVGGNTRLNDNNIYLRPGTDVNHGLGYYYGSKSFGGDTTIDGPVLFGFAGGRLGTEQFGAEHIAVAWTATSVTVYGTFNNLSDRNAKENFRPISSEEMLNRVLQVPVTEWSYKTDPATRHIGPTAQDFHAAFGVGTDERHIAPIDEGGVALAAIQGLNQKVEIRAQQSEQQLATLRTQNSELKQRNAALEKRLEALEELVLRKSRN